MRRCGWLDLVLLKYSTAVNHYTRYYRDSTIAIYLLTLLSSLNITKLDVLDGLHEIKVAVKYVIDGQELISFPGGLETAFSGVSEKCMS